MMKNNRHDIFSVYALLCDFDLCKSEHVFSVEFLGRSRTYFAYLKSSKNRPAVEALVFLAAKLLDVSTGLLSSQAVTTELRCKTEKLRQAAGDILKLAVQTAQARTHSNTTLSINPSLDGIDACAEHPLGTAR
jgi:hypothetical protein